MRWVWLLLFVATLWSRAAFADQGADQADLAEAGREFAAGQAADRKKDWPTAIQHYVRANDLAPHPNAMFNIGSAYDKLGNLRQAAVWYQRYVEASPDAPDHDKIVKLIRALAVRPATLTVRTIPAGARISVDGEPRGTTPYSGKIDGGRHRITLEHEGRKEDREISVEFGEPAVLDLTLRGEAGTLRVVGPPGAVLLVDDMPAGSLPVSIDLPPGPHALKVTSYGYAPFEATVDITPNRETVVNAQMSRARGSLDGTRTIKAGYLFGGGGGADIKGSGVVGLIELGFQALRYDAAVRIGKAGGRTALDFVARWAIGNAKLTPYIGAGYSVIVAKDDGETSTTESSQGGYVLIGGLRYVLAQNEHSMFAAVAESGLRYYPGAAGTSDDGSTLLVPLMFTLQVVYK